ncbi:MAG: WbqC family protein [Saprospirales bacterium]|nr:WbqC family protein [Saprospirales bacterium]
MTALLELQFLPPVQYFTKLVAYPHVVLEQKEHYRKRSYRNRCHIAAARGTLRLSVPLQKGKNEQMPIREVRIAYDQAWQKHLEHSIRSAYRSAPFFEEYAPPILETLHRKEVFLFDLNLLLLEQTCGFLGIKPNWALSSEYASFPPEGWDDLRNAIHPVHPSEDPLFLPRAYNQVFEDKHGFSPNLSIIDLLFCTGPEALSILKASIRTF